jgi:putative CocE/NonD family hydrolase
VPFRPAPSRRDLIKFGSAAFALAQLPAFAATALADEVHYLKVRDKVPDPKDIFFSVHYPGAAPLRLAGHYWYNADTLKAGEKCPAIVEFVPYRRRDGTMIADSKMYPWFAYNDYLCFRIDLQGSGDSEGVLTDEYTEEELVYCIQVIAAIAALPTCDGNVGMMGKSWSAINSLMVAARPDRPEALKAVLVCSGSDDRYDDDVHYMGGAMMFDNVSWPSSMWGWLSLPPDPAVVGAAWQEMWRTRIRNADFWFRRWATHQSRDAYWQENSVRGHFADVQVPVFVMSGWQDGYKNPVERIVSGLSALGKPVQGLLGPWGHKYPYGGYPGPRIPWLHYTVTHWWDKWLKGKTPPPGSDWPQLPVWLSDSQPPVKSPCADETGQWVAEDGDWRSRMMERVFYLGSDHRLGAAPSAARYANAKPLVLDTAMLETSSWGECGNDDLPGDQARFDMASLYFDSDPLAEDFAIFGYPVVALTLAVDRPAASLAIRLCEIEPGTGASHLVTYRFYNLAYRDGDMATPEKIAPGKTFALRIPLNIAGHVFKRGWRIRLALSPSFYPTLWQSADAPTVVLFAGEVDGLEPSALILPGRPPRAEDRITQRLLPASSVTEYVNPGDYLPTLATTREAKSTREATPITLDGKPGMLVRKVFDSGRYQYGGPLKGLWIDQQAEENFQMIADEPLSLTGFTTSAATLERPDTGWRASSETATRVWSELNEAGEAVFRYSATVRGFVGPDDVLLEEKKVEGTIKREWI